MKISYDKFNELFCNAGSPDQYMNVYFDEYITNKRKFDLTVNYGLPVDHWWWGFVKSLQFEEKKLLIEQAMNL